MATSVPAKASANPPPPSMTPAVARAGATPMATAPRTGTPSMKLSRRGECKTRKDVGVCSGDMQRYQCMYWAASSAQWKRLRNVLSNAVGTQLRNARASRHRALGDDFFPHEISCEALSQRSPLLWRIWRKCAPYDKAAPVARPRPPKTRCGGTLDALVRGLDAVGRRWEARRGRPRPGSWIAPGTSPAPW
jgi:hypothetical protein